MRLYIHLSFVPNPFLRASFSSSSLHQLYTYHRILYSPPALYIIGLFHSLLCSPLFLSSTFFILCPKHPCLTFPPPPGWHPARPDCQCLGLEEQHQGMFETMMIMEWDYDDGRITWKGQRWWIAMRRQRYNAGIGALSASRNPFSRRSKSPESHWDRYGHRLDFLSAKFGFPQNRVKDLLAPHTTRRVLFCREWGRVRP